ncbi:MAG: MotA/TolQ/ExbB proton channel family protein [Cyclobacteriaceae bacterium]
MFDLFYMGGPLFMGILTLVFICMICVAVVNGLPIFRGEIEDLEVIARRIGYVKSVGLFALIVGILGQLIGLFAAFQFIEKAVDISPSLLASGFKVSMITTLYGVFIYVFSLLIWFGLSAMLKRKED